MIKLFGKNNNFCFEELKDKSRWDILFLAIFLIMLFIPMLNINEEFYSEDENRTLASAPQLLKKNHKINQNFGKDFDNWFNDRFFTRQFLTRQYQKLVYLFAYEIVDTNYAVLNKKTHWIFTKENFDSDQYTKERAVNILAENLNKFGDYWAERGIKFYVLLAPYQEDIYYEKIAPYPVNSAYKVHNEAAEQIKRLSRYPVIYPYNELKAATKNDYTYFKTDYHWTEYGASIANEILLNEIKKDYPNVKIDDASKYDVFYRKEVMRSLDREFGSGESLKMYFPFLQNSKTFLDTDYRYYMHKNADLLKHQTMSIPYKKIHLFYYPYGADIKVIVIGNSMNEILLRFLPYAFKKLKFIRINNVKKITEREKYKILKYYKDEILRYKPDIIILSITRSVLLNSADFMSEE